MLNSSYPQFTLTKGTAFSECLEPVGSCSNLERITPFERKGELYFAFDGQGQPTQATFYNPNISICRPDSAEERNPGGPSCEFSVSFRGGELKQLIDADQQLRSDAVIHQETERQVLGRLDPGYNKSEKSSQTVSPGNTLASSILSPLLIFFGIAVLALIIYKAAGIRLGYGGTVKYRNSPSKRSSRSPLTPSDFSAAAPPQARSASSDDMRQQLLLVVEKLHSISSRLSRVETEVVALTQQIQSPTLKVSSPSSSSAFTNSDIPSNQYMPPPPPSAPLSLELIREAVLTNNYSLIASYPHHFVSETPESRQGLEDVKRFTIEGDQSKASGRTQSEFIVVPFSTELYLIPNILPNAADPARTIKRHADKNNIYRNGQGANLLNLISLAVVRRNGDRYDLASTGQIA